MSTNPASDQSPFDDSDTLNTIIFSISESIGFTHLLSNPNWQNGQVSLLKSENEDFRMNKLNKITAIKCINSMNINLPSV